MFKYHVTLSSFVDRSLNDWISLVTYCISWLFDPCKWDYALNYWISVYRLYVLVMLFIIFKYFILLLYTVSQKRYAPWCLLIILHINICQSYYQTSNILFWDTVYLWMCKLVAVENVTCFCMAFVVFDQVVAVALKSHLLPLRPRFPPPLPVVPLWPVSLAWWDDVGSLA